MSPADWAVLAVSFVVIIGYGLWRSRGRQSLESYVVAGKQMRWWVIGLSIMATQASAVTFIGTTSQGYADGLRFVQFYFGLPIAMVLIAAVAAPVFHRSGVYTAYEYLERRFDAKTRTLAGLVFLVQRGLGVGLALYAPAVVLSVILELPEWATIAATGVMVSAYTMIGGIKAVMWTDALQMTVMLAGVVAAFFAAAAGLPEDVSLGSALRLAGAAGKLNAVESSLDWNSRYTLWSGLIGGAFLALAYFGADQSQVQRYLTAKSVEHSRVSLLFNAVLKVPLQFFILLTGVVIFAFFIFERPPMLFHAGEKARVEQAGGRPARLGRIALRGSVRRPALGRPALAAGSDGVRAAGLPGCRAALPRRSGRGGVACGGRPRTRFVQRHELHFSDFCLAASARRLDRLDHGRSLRRRDVDNLVGIELLGDGDGGRSLRALHPPESRRRGGAPGLEAGDRRLGRLRNRIRGLRGASGLADRGRQLRRGRFFTAPCWGSSCSRSSSANVRPTERFGERRSA